MDTRAVGKNGGISAPKNPINDILLILVLSFFPDFGLSGRTGGPPGRAAWRSGIRDNSNSGALGPICGNVRRV